MYERPLGPPNSYDRVDDDPARARVVWPEKVLVQGADLNEAGSIEARRNRRVGNMSAKDGDRQSGAAIIINSSTSTATLDAGTVYVKGDVRPVAAATLTGLTMTGPFAIGVKLQTTLVTGADDPTLYGLQPGTDAEGEPGGAREREVLVWAKDGDMQDGDFYPVYALLNGVVVDQNTPPILTGVIQQIAGYDFDANHNYIVDGCEVTAIGKVGTDQIFSIGAGTANIKGFKRIREVALRFAATEDPSLDQVTAEIHNYDASTGSPNTTTVNQPPIGAVTAIVIVKRATGEVVTRSSTPNGNDNLAHPSIVTVEDVYQGATHYVNPTDYTVSGGHISWAPGGAEPAGLSTYNVTYLYNDATSATLVTDTQVTYTGGVHNQPAQISYTSKIPRKDLLCLDIFGAPAYVKGVSARKNLTPPLTPSALLKLAVITNDWLNKPDIANDGTHSIPYDLAVRYFARLIDLLDQFDRQGLANAALAADPVAKKGIFTDAFKDDRYRDQGATQTAAVYDNTCCLAIDQVLLVRVGDFESLPYTEDIILSQTLATSGQVINPYANFTQMPAGMVLEPPTDFWTDQVTTWTSPITSEFQAAPDQPPGTTVFDTTVSQRTSEAEFIRQIVVTFTLSGFGVGENLSSMHFAGVAVTPAGMPLTADGTGTITSTFTIPATVPSGTVLVRADGAAGSYAEALYTGAGEINTVTMQRVTLVARAAPVPTPVTVPPPTPAQKVSQPVILMSSLLNMNGHGGDPLAQTFALIEDRAVVGVDVKLQAVGSASKGIRCQLVGVTYGLPNEVVLAEAFINMTGVHAGDIVSPRFDAPVWCTADRQYAFVFLTDDNTHALSIAKLGDVDQATQTFVSSQPYTVGTLLLSSNRVTWTPQQDADLWFRVIGAHYTSTARTLALWTGAFTNISDILVRGTVDLPTADATFHYELTRADTSVIKLVPGQEYSFDTYVTETVSLSAVFGGTAKVAPTLYPGSTLVGGQLRTSGIYISDVFTLGTGVDVTATFAAYLPAGATVTVDVDAADNSWVAATQIVAPDLGSGWKEPKFKKTSYTAVQGRVRVTLNGSAAYRPRIAQLRAYSI